MYDGSSFDDGRFCTAAPCRGEAMCAAHRDMPGLNPSEPVCNPALGDLAGSWSLPYYPSWHSVSIAPNYGEVPYDKRYTQPESEYGREFLGDEEEDYFGVDVTHMLANKLSVEVPEHHKASTSGPVLGLFVRKFDSDVRMFLETWRETLQRVYSRWYIEVNAIELHDAPVLCTVRHSVCDCLYIGIYCATRTYSRLRCITPALIVCLCIRACGAPLLERASRESIFRFFFHWTTTDLNVGTSATSNSTVILQWTNHPLSA